ncbi:MAG: STAS domain-containing protein [Nitrosomonadales bacterium]|jgi:phospholipid transport system transporter-binding protein|nr:STAS domain-containing protein [Nitrosomonadales bacterium]MBT3917730.1 STAS domain-containing protein [Nitrosomonadales bacterium]MBT4183174.1 STAS domain-containing protein [Nitrosomonadales bacterium]MBT4570939.1 STAS domain-containing protein [Nitrosomonadales bacterium]MBT4758916.1 STAS domain-containing protein [Nitrosomonadales bacterium]
MPLNIESEPNLWKLSGPITFNEITSLIDKTKNFNWADSVQIDFSQVKHVDTSALSLIFEWKREAKSRSCNVTINTPPKNLLKLARLYGVEDFI